MDMDVGPTKKKHSLKKDKRVRGAEIIREEGGCLSEKKAGTWSTKGKGSLGKTSY